MGLYLDLNITSGSGSTTRLGTMDIIRTEPLVNRDDPHDETHTYKTSIWNHGRVIQGPETFEHRYGDGAWMCVRRALEALGQ